VRKRSESDVKHRRKKGGGKEKEKKMKSRICGSGGLFKMRCREIAATGGSKGKGELVIVEGGKGEIQTRSNAEFQSSNMKQLTSA